MYLVLSIPGLLSNINNHLCTCNTAVCYKQYTKLKNDNTKTLVANSNHCT